MSDQSVKSIKRITLIGDSLLSNIVSKGLEKDHDYSIKVRSHSGATSLDIIDHVRPEARKCPDKILLMIGTNDLTSKGMDTIKNLKEALKTIKEPSPQTSVTLTTVPVRKDIANSGQKLADINNRLKTFAHQHNCDLINLGKIDATCLGGSKLHFNQKGNRVLANIFINYCKSI